jgi:hypothetical protein
MTDSKGIPLPPIEGDLQKKVSIHNFRDSALRWKQLGMWVDYDPSTKTAKISRPEHVEIGSGKSISYKTISHE